MPDVELPPTDGFDEEMREAMELASLQTDIYTPTDDGNALRLIDDHQHRYRRIADMRKWFVWDGARWAQDHEDRAIREAARNQARTLPQNTKEARAWQNKSMSAM